jgi:hypothetical protein
MKHFIQHNYFKILTRINEYNFRFFTTNSLTLSLYLVLLNSTKLSKFLFFQRKIWNKCMKNVYVSEITNYVNNQSLGVLL